MTIYNDNLQFQGSIITVYSLVYHRLLGHLQILLSETCSTCHQSHTGKYISVDELYYDIASLFQQVISSLTSLSTARETVD